MEDIEQYGIFMNTITKESYTIEQLFGNMLDIAFDSGCKMSDELLDEINSKIAEMLDNDTLVLVGYHYEDRDQMNEDLPVESVNDEYM